MGVSGGQRKSSSFPVYTAEDPPVKGTNDLKCFFCSFPGLFIMKFQSEQLLTVANYHPVLVVSYDCSISYIRFDSSL